MSVNAILLGQGGDEPEKLKNARTIQTDLGSTSAADFDGSADITPGVTGTLGLANGGTGATGADVARTNLSVYSKTEVDDKLDNIKVKPPEMPTSSDTYSAWGDETAIGDSIWWTNLSNWAKTAPHEAKLALVGKTKKVSLSTAVLGANAATMVCIGVDQDGIGTMTFQTAGILPTITNFGSNAQWIGSTARSLCQNFYNYCSAKNAIKTVSKGTCPNANDGKNGTPTYTNETVWLLSEREMGLDSSAPISVANSTTSKAECTQGYNDAYSYYIDNNKRIKYMMSADGTVGSTKEQYWERSRYYNSGYPNNVCVVGPNGTVGTGSPSIGRGLAPAFVIGGNTSFDWGAETGTDSDATWWAKLSNILSLCGPENLKSFLGKTKQVTLSAAVLGTTTHLVRCIGYNCDGDKTLTFQTMNCLANTTVFCTDEEYDLFEGEILWTDGTNDSQVRRQCKDYYNAFPGKASIKIVAKKYLSTQPNNSHTTACDKQYDETVFLPSECEMGFTSGYSGANDEFAVANTSKTAYQYYTGNDKRVKYLGTNNNPEGQTSGGQWYQERSRFYSSGYPNNVCRVNGDGAAGISTHNTSRGLAPAFAIGPTQFEVDIAFLGTGSYTGTGLYGDTAKNQIVFPVIPKFVEIKNSIQGLYYSVKIFYGQTSANFNYSYSNTANLTCEWSGNTLTWYSANADFQLNQSGVVYNYDYFA